jgi:SWI/SNF-related matrix-associated actin-dependent regulator 1 of chromatin subfamily A
MGVQYKSGGVGIDLTRAHYCVLFSPTYSLGDYDQSLARLDRPGQVSHVQFYHLVAKDTVDEVVYDALDKKRSVVESVLEALRTRQKESETCEASS